MTLIAAAVSTPRTPMTLTGGSGQLSFLEALTTLSARCDGSGS
jgi:hypothetical protein